jgi:hypothetical protein
VKVEFLDETTGIAEWMWVLTAHKVQVVSVRRELEPQVLQGFGRHNLSVAVGRNIAQPQALLPFVIHHMQDIFAIGRNGYWKRSQSASREPVAGPCNDRRSRHRETANCGDVVKHKIGECYKSAASGRAAVARAYERHTANRHGIG